jgi:hypothetical protein
MSTLKSNQSILLRGMNNRYSNRRNNQNSKNLLLSLRKMKRLSVYVWNGKS